MPAPALENQSQVDAVQEQVISSLATASAGRAGSDRSAVDAGAPSFRLAVPRRGHVLSTVAEIYGNPIREAVDALCGSLVRKSREDIAKVLRSWRAPNHAVETYRIDAKGVAWVIVSIWVTGVATKALSISATLAEAEGWFFGHATKCDLTKLLSAQAIRTAETALRAVADASAYLELLPYILDPHGPGSRLSVRRDPATRAARSRKRADGVFYTPADIAEYMAGACLDTLGANVPPTVFDPACGTGVFLRAALSSLKRRHSERDTLSLASECLFGADIDAWSLDAAAFVLLADTWTDSAGQDLEPVAAWQRLRLNFACIDTLLIDPAEAIPPITPRDQNNSGRLSISRLFSALKRGPTAILGNPPYADLGPRRDLAELQRVFKTVATKPKPTAELYLVFVEQMIRLAGAKTCAGALVLPLSIACNIGPQFTTVRKLIAETRGRWRFAFFDREPHALFGEDVKTRNAIILWSKASSDERAVLATGPLRKWRGDSRAAMFRSLRFTEINADIRAGIPKIEGDCQAAALGMLSFRLNRLEQALQSTGRITLADIPDADDKTVFVGPTAYNFLNVFLKPQRAVLHGNQNLSEHPLHYLRCSSRQDALAVFAILSSHLAFWWWHTHGDGFHVSSRLISELPFGVDALIGQTISTLSECGEQLWSAISSNPIISLNGGRTSLAYTPNGHDNIRRRIDQTLADIAGLECAFVDELQQFTARTVSATLRDHAI